MLRENFSLSPEKFAIGSLAWLSSAPLETETFCHASSLRSGLFSVASSPRAPSQEGDRMMAWGQEGKKHLARMRRDFHKIFQCAFGFFGGKNLEGGEGCCLLLQAFISAFPVLHG